MSVNIQTTYKGVIVMLALQTEIHLEQPSQNILTEKFSFLKPLVSEAINVITDHHRCQTLFSNMDDLRKRLAIFLIKTGDFKGGLKFTNSENKFEFADVIMKIGKEQLKIGNVQDALEEVNQFKDQYDKNSYLLYLAYKRAKYRDFEGAKIMLNRFENMQIEKTLRIYLIRLYAAVGQFDDAKKIDLELSTYYQIPKYRTITYFAIARARLGDIEGARNELEQLNQEKDPNKDGVFNETIINFLANAQIKIQDFKDALETIKLFSNEKPVSRKSKDKLLVKLGEAQFKAGNIEGANKTAELISKSDFKDKLNYIINSTLMFTPYWKVTNYWKSYGDEYIINSDYRFWHEVMVDLPKQQTLDEFLKDRFIPLTKLSHIALKIFASASIQEGKIEEALEPIRYIDSCVGRASVLVELLEESFESQPKSFNRTKRAIQIN